MIQLGLATLTLLALGLLPMLGASAAGAEDDHPVVVLDTTAGPITLELDRARAPLTVDNFLKYVDASFYDNTVFHRVIPGFMIQGGGFTEQQGALMEKPTREPIKNESGNGLSNQRGTIAMARTSNPDSATAQFFINLADNSRLDHYGGGYAVFGRVTAGLDAVDRITKIPTGQKEAVVRDPRGNTLRDALDDVPTTTVLIKSARRKPRS